MKFAAAIVFNAFNVDLRVEGSFFPQVTIGFLTLAVMYWLWQRYRHRI